MARCIMVQGTMSGAGKSLLTAALCRIFKQDGYRVAPFKSQNMALNSYITADGLEMGRAQVVQAQAAGKEPDVRMNPILLKPSSDVGSQLIINGKVRGNYKAMDYFRRKKEYIPDILEAYNSLANENDIIVIEGAGSPAEINLKQNDIVNMGLAELVNAPVLLVGDIDRGGVFAQLFGTVELLEQKEKDRIVGTIINKFRGDPKILEPGLAMMEGKTGVPVLGVVPYTHAVIDDEDSLAEELQKKEVHKPIDIAVIRLPRISNFTDFTPLEEHPLLGVRYVTSHNELGIPDLIILPGTKSTMADLKWLRQSGLEMRIRQLAANGVPVIGICGGYQMMGRRLSDPEGVEGGGIMDGMDLLPVETVFAGDKVRTRKRAAVTAGMLANTTAEGYEIHMGISTVDENAEPFCRFEDGQTEGAVYGSCMGTYLHGLFDRSEVTICLAEELCRRKGIQPETVEAMDHKAFQETQIDLLASEVRNALNLKAIYAAMDRFAEIQEKDAFAKCEKQIPVTKGKAAHTTPSDIERTSMQIITDELAQMRAQIPENQMPVVCRVIHTTADFEYVKNLVFTPDAVRAGCEALKRGGCIVTDTNMARSGVNKTAMEKLGIEALCYMTDSEVIARAKEQKTTRAYAAMGLCAERHPGAILAVGNAPTALFAIREQIEKGYRPALVIAVPVGFVNVVEAKEEILACCREYGIPAITAMGRKGGSTVATAICNALLYLAADMIDPSNRGWN